MRELPNFEFHDQKRARLKREQEERERNEREKDQEFTRQQTELAKERERLEEASKAVSEPQPRYDMPEFDFD
jgi:hypothetical protein